MSRKSITALFLVLLLMVQTLCPVVATAQGNWNDDCPVPHAYIVCTNCNTTADATCEYHEATCAEDGYYLHRCNNCGQLMNSDNGGNNIIGISRANKATGHDFEIVSTLKEGSCTVKGIYKLQCSLCGEVKYEGQYAHQFVEGVADATCTEPAMVGEVCELCGATNGDMTVVEGSEALGHDWVLDTDAEDYVAATCEEGGHNVYKCSRCDETMEEDVEALGHQWDDGEYAEPDCTHAGGVKYTCTVCGDTWVDVFTGELEEPALQHTEVEIPAVEPTCSEVGWTAGTKCSVCGEIITAPTEVPVNEDAHVAVLDKVLKEATCTTTGVGKYVCELCGENLGYRVIADGHKWDEGTVTKAATCGEDGEKLLTCSVCQETKTEVIPATGEHDFEESFVDATCTEPAKAGQVCKVCGATNGDMTAVEGSEALGHDWVLDTDAEGYVAATCEESGHNVYKCSRCGDTDEKDVEALGHQWDDGEYAEPDCTHAGGVKYTCTVCGDTWVDEFTGELEEPALGHTEVEIPAVEPTCSEVGWTAGTKCSVCGEIITAPTEVPVDEDAHVAVLGKVLKEATCTTTGVGKYVCELCGENLGYRVIADGHKWDEGIVTKAATCGEDGERELTCSVCQETKTEVIPATGEHDFEESFVDATCTEPAKAGQVCKVCGATNGDMTVVEGSEPLGHDWVLDTDAEDYVAATCEEGGHNVYKCSRCDETMEEDVEALGHQWDDGEYAEPDCTHAGGVKYTCTVCGDTWVDEFTGELEEPALQHTEEAVADVPATCTTPGWTGKVICSVCNEVLVEGEEIPVDSNAHVFEEIVIKPATCSAQGIGRYVCTECGYSTYKAIAVAHTWSEEKVSEDSTYVYRYCTVCGAVDILATLDGFEDTDCTANGKHTVVDVPEVPATSTSTGLTAGKKCSVCGEILEGCEVIPMLTCEHVPAEAVTEDEVPATCTTAGSYSLVVYCTVCNEEISRETVVVDALGHTEETIPGKPATCTEDGLTDGVKCSVCGDIIKAQEVIEATGHVEETVPGKAATCTEAGLTDGVKCSVCGEIIKAQEEISIIDHTPEEVPAVEPTCTKPGMTSGVKCAVCGEILEGCEEIPALEHSPEEIPGKAATCTEDGLTDGAKCSVCGDIIKAQEVIKATGHVEETIPGKAATCTEDGLTDGVKCSVCGDIIKAQEVIKATGHVEETIPGKPATCTEDGLTDGAKCSVCGDIIKAQETINALGHSYTVRYSFNEDYTKRLATYTCSLCGDSYTVEEDY